MANKEKTQNKKPKISAYWLYGLIALFFIIMSYFNNDGMTNDQRINISTFERFLNDDEVERVLVINKTLAQVIISGVGGIKFDYVHATKLAISLRITRIYNRFALS